MLFSRSQAAPPTETIPSTIGIKLNDSEFAQFQQLIFNKAGINLGEHKKELVRTRLQKRLRDKGFGSYSEYYRYVTEVDTQGEELVHLIDAISTNKTDFFREKQHFDYLTAEALPRLIEAKNRARERRLRIWSAGCSTGEEPYTLAIVLSQAIPNLSAWDFKILATDISTRALDRAQNGVYSADQIAGVPPNLRPTYFSIRHEGGEKSFEINPALRSMISFRRLNLMDDPFPFRGMFDVIFCRNVMIYFDKPTQEKLVNKYHRYLAPGGYLFIGHSESLTGIKTPFQYVMPTIYRK